MPKKYHTDHHEVIVKEDILNILPNLAYQYEEPFADPSILPTWLLMQESKKHFTVALNGDGGDENFAGYRRYKVMKLFNLLKAIPAKDILGSLFDMLYRYYPTKDFAQIARILRLSSSNYKLFYQDLISFLDRNIRYKLYSSELKQKIKASRPKYLLVDKFKEANKVDLLDQLLYVDINTYLPEVLLTKTDISSMAFSLEVRSPFLDHEFMELTAKMPSNLKLKGFTSKYILKKIAKEYLPKQCIYRKKQPFLPPLDKWFRSDLSGYLNENLLNKEMIKLGILDEQTIKRLIDSHIQYKENNAYLLWTIICLNQWLNVWFRK